MDSWGPDEEVHVTPTKVHNGVKRAPSITPLKHAEQIAFPEGLCGHDDEAHRKGCRAVRCSRCMCLKHQKEWATQFPWLQVRLDVAQATFGIGCTLCAEGATSDEFKKLGLLVKAQVGGFVSFSVKATAKTDLRTQRLSNHADTPAHKMAESLLATGSFSSDGAAPRADDWAKVYTFSMTKGAMTKEGIEGIGKAKKICKMQYCLAEAQRDETRKNLLEAICISIAQDKRNTRFLMRYKCCNERLEVVSGILTHARDVSDVQHQGADSVRRATILGIEHACSKLAGPDSSEHKKSILDRALFEVVVQKVECFAADGASDEQRAGRELAGNLNLCGPDVQELRGALAQTLPALKANHAQRCWQ
jgi:hypothetical protein